MTGPNRYQLTTFGLATAISTILVWVIDELGGGIPAEVAASITTLIYAILAYAIGEIGSR